MKEILEQLFELNKDSKFVKSSQDIERIFSKSFVISPFKVLQKQILELLGNDEIIFGLEETASGFLFTPNFFIIIGGSKGIIKYDYFFLPKIEIRPKSLFKNGSYLLEGREIIGLGTKSEEFFNILIQIKSKIGEIDFSGVNQNHRNTQHRSTTLTPLGMISNQIERFGEKEMNPWEIKEIQENFKLEVIQLDYLESLLRVNEQTIVNSEKGFEYLQKFIRLKKYLENLQVLIESKLEESKNKQYLFKKNLTRLINEIKGLNKSHESIYSISIIMINKYIGNELIDFFDKYELLDKLGVFNSQYENQVLNKLNSIESELNSINSQLSYMNVLLTYNTYQLRLIEKTLS
ncbi:MAG: hypothetical protein RLZ47_396 [Bacteroidota bacterium]|jgi:hypothetical protein